MKRLIRTTTGLFVWSCCVAGVATGSWIAIDSAGRRIGLSTEADGDHPRLPPTTTTPTTATPTTTTPADTVSPTAAPTPDGTGPRTTATKPTWGTGDPGKMTARSEPGDTAGTQAVPVVDRVTTPGGVVELECTGTVVSGYNVQPDGGWSARVRRVSSSSIEASFRHDRREIDVRGSCGSGKPEFRDGHD